MFALCSIVAASFGYFLIYRQTVAQAGHSATAALEVANESIKKQHEQELVGIHKETTDERAKIALYFIPEDAAVDFIEKIEKVGTDSQTELELSTIISAEDKIKAKIVTRGTWSGVMNALMLLENMPLGIILSNVRLDTSGDLESSDKKSTRAHSWQLTLDVEALTRKASLEE